METEKIGLPGLSEWKTRKREALARWEKHQQAMHRFVEGKSLKAPAPFNDPWFQLAVDEASILDYAHQNSVDPKGSSFMDLLNGVPEGSQRRAISQARLRLMNAILALHSGRLAPTAVAFHHLGYAMDALEHAVPVHIRERNRAKRGSGSRLGTMIRDSFQVNSPAAKAEVHLDWLAQREGWTLESDVVRARQSRKRLFTLAHFRNALAMERKQLRVNS